MSDFSNWTSSQPDSEVLRAYRILDANLNRSMEGLRVIEDCLRYGLNAQNLVRNCKVVRHELGEIANSLSIGRRMVARDLDGDVGTSIETATEYSRTTIRELIQANCERVKQSFRVLEETTKLSALDDHRVHSLPKRLERLRYDFYKFEQAVSKLFFESCDWTNRFLYVLTDARSSENDFSNLVEELIDANVDVVQLRDKHLDDRTLRDRAEILVELTRGSRTIAIINDRPDIAAVVAADGVHVGQTELEVKTCRKVLGMDSIVGLSTHSPEQVAQASQSGADYLGVGPIFSSKTKSFRTTEGVKLIESVVSTLELPWFAIGGIDEQNIESVLAAGARRVAVSHAIIGDDHPGHAAKRIRDLIVAHDAVVTREGPTA